MEGWHFKINRIISIKHPNIHRFLHFLRDEQDYQEKRLLMLEAVQQTVTQKRKWLNLKTKYLRHRQEYLAGTRNLLSYLDVVKHLIHTTDHS